MGKRQEARHFYRIVAIMSFILFILVNVYIFGEPAGSLSTFCLSTLLATVRSCFSAADYFQELGRRTFENWQADPRHRYPFPAHPPAYIAYSQRSLEFVATVFRYIGSSLASQAISYRNYGSSNAYTLWPARLVVTARGLFLPDSLLNLSFTPAWATNLRSFRWA